MSKGFNQKTAGATTGVIDRLHVHRVYKIDYQFDDMAWGEIFTKIIADRHRMFQEILEYIALHIGPRVEQGQGGKSFNNRSKGFRSSNCQPWLEYVSTVIVGADQARQNSII